MGQSCMWYVFRKCKIGVKAKWAKMNYRWEVLDLPAIVHASVFIKKCFFLHEVKVQKMNYR